MPSYGCVQTPLCVSYLVRNRTLQVQEVEVTVEPSDAFMYSGHKQVSSGVFLSGLSYKQARAVSCFYAGRKYVHMIHQVIVASKCTMGLFYGDGMRLSFLRKFIIANEKSDSVPLCNQTRSKLELKTSITQFMHYSSKQVRIAYFN